MASLKETAKEFIPKQTNNIADLQSVSVELELAEETNVEFPYKFIVVGGERYRVPNSVISNIKAILEENANLKTFKVKKTGTGLNTEYTVIPLA